MEEIFTMEKTILIDKEKIGFDKDFCHKVIRKRNKFLEINNLPKITFTDVIPKSYCPINFINNINDEIYEKIENNILKIGIDISINKDSHPFDYIIPRDFFDIKNPDLAFAARNKKTPVVGVFKVHAQKEYGELQRHREVDNCIDKYIKKSGHVRLHLNTFNWKEGSKFLAHSTSNVAQLESLIGKCDYIITSRMHGLVYSLKCDIPALAIDCIAGGAKVTAQAEAVGWPAIVNGDGITVEDIENGVRVAINNKDKIKQLNIDALKKISEIEKQLINYLNENK